MNRLSANTVVSGFLLPSLILGVSVLLLKLLGETEPPNRPEISNSLTAQMRRLPAAQVLPIKGLSEVNGVLDIEVDGEVVPFREVQIATEVAGRIVFKSSDCEAGNYVNAGELLFKIDPTDYELEIARLQKQKQSEHETLNEIDQEITNADKLHEVARKDEALRENEIARLEKLPQGFASESELDQAKQGRLLALNTRIGYENQVALLKTRRIRQETVEELVDSQLDLAKKNLERTEIRAPISGVVYREDAELNSFVQRGNVIVTLEDTAKAEIVVNLRMDELFWVLDQVEDSLDGAEDSRSYKLPRTKATVEYRINGRNAVYQWEGWLEGYDGIGVDTSSRMVPVRIVVEAPDRLQGSGPSIRSRIKGPKALVRGMFVRATLHVRPQTPLTLIPNLAIQPGNRVWKFDADPAVLEHGSSHDASGENATVNTSATEFDLANWQAGRLSVVENINPVSSVELPIRDGPEMTKYWICEANPDSLSPGDLVVVSPLGAVVGDGSDVLRVSNQVEAKLAESIIGTSLGNALGSIK